MQNPFPELDQPIFPALWFDNNAREAADFYGTVFPDSRILSDIPVAVNFELWGQKFMGINGGPMFKITPSISFYVVFDTEAEVVAAWEKLSEGGKVMMALDKYFWSDKYGWVEDRFGVSWQLALGKFECTDQRILPCLLFTGENFGRAEAAIHFYQKTFPNTEILSLQKYGEEAGPAAGKVLFSQINLDKTVFILMDGPGEHAFHFNEAVSFSVGCANQEEIDYYWETLKEGGSEQQCGWLKDKFGVSWQIVPSVLGKLMDDSSKRQAVVDAFLKMKKFDLEALLAV
ncbi:MAG: VOC family protein [Bacteroidia bacterium]|nr:VOC family protein [Bacteroidia bacterium]